MQSLESAMSTMSITPSHSQEYLTYDTDYVPPAFPLGNPGALCWFNSLLQTMLGMSALNRAILEAADDLHDNVFAREYIRILNVALAGDGASLAGASSTLLQAMIDQARRERIPLSLGNGQECADEGFVKFVELLKCPHVEKLFDSVYELNITCTSCKKVASSVRDRSSRIQMFSQVPITTQDLFARYLRAHPSECSYYKCDCGHTMANFQRVEKLKMLREIMVIVFDKFVAKSNKWFPETLSFRNTSGGQTQYKLIGKIEHSGTMHSGHYWAHSLRGRWMQMNDTSVHPGSSTPAPGTFMVVYHMTVAP